MIDGQLQALHPGKGVPELMLDVRFVVGEFQAEVSPDLPGLFVEIDPPAGHDAEIPPGGSPAVYSLPRMHIDLIVLIQRAVKIRGDQQFLHKHLRFLIVRSHRSGIPCLYAERDYSYHRLRYTVKLFSLHPFYNSSDRIAKKP